MSNARRALLVGIDEYRSNPLQGCVFDAQNLQKLLEHDEDGTKNFACKLLTGPPHKVDRNDLLRNVHELFDQKADVALFAFSGHGSFDPARGGYLVTQDYKSHDIGVSMAEVLAMASASRVKEIFILLDCCKAASFAEPASWLGDVSLLRPGMSVLAATDRTATAYGGSQGGYFTSAVCDALAGGAADTLGKVTAASIYSYINEVFGPWDQRPNFKSNVSTLIPLRSTKSSVPIDALRRVHEYFPESDTQFQLGPEYEHSDKRAKSDKVKVMKDLRNLRDAGLLKVDTHEHLYDAALHSGTCSLTSLGRYYRRLSRDKKL